MVTIPQLKRWALVTASLRPPANAGEQRLARIAQATLTGMGTRIISGVLLWCSIPLILTFLGDERNGIWIVLSAALGALGIADLGFGNSVLNALSSSLAANDQPRCRQVVSTALALLTLLGFLLAALLLPLAGQVNWSSRLNAPGSQPNEITWAVRTVIFVFALNLPLSLLPKIFTACQQGHLANIITFAGNAAGFGMLLLAIHVHASLSGLILAVHGTAALIWMLAALVWFYRSRPWMRPTLSAVHTTSARLLWTEGWKFFILQIGGVVSLQIDALILSWRINAESVTPFYNAQKLFLIAAMVQGVSFPYFWAAFAEARARGDHAWMKRVLRRGSIVTVLCTAALALPVALLAEPLTHWWLKGRLSAMPDATLVWWHCAWVLLSSSMSVAAGVLNAHGRLLGQLIYLPLAAVVNLALSIWWATRFGPSGVIAGTVVSFALCCFLPIWIEASAVLRRQTGATPLAA